MPAVIVVVISTNGLLLDRSHRVTPKGYMTMPLYSIPICLEQQWFWASYDVAAQSTKNKRNVVTRVANARGIMSL
jgi:hypothetical protein